MENENSLGAREALAGFGQASHAVSTEVEAAEPSWMLLALGFWGPAMACAFRYSGYGRWLLPIALVIPSLIALVVFNLRLQRRMRPKATTIADIRTSNTKENRKRMHPITIVNLVAYAVIIALARTDITSWFVLPISYVAVMCSFFWTESRLREIRRDHVPVPG